MTKLTDASRKRFLKFYSACGVIGEAARLARVGRRSHYEWMSDPEYQRDFALATEEAGDLLETELVDRVFHGSEEVIVYQGEVQYVRDARGKPTKVPLTVRRKNDTLLIFALKGVRPQKFRDQWKGEIDLKGDLHTTTSEVDLKKLTNEQLAELDALLRAATSDVAADRPTGDGDSGEDTGE